MKYQKELEKYADLILEIGIHLQKDDKLFLNYSTHARDLALIVQKKAYEKGAKEVFAYSNDDAFVLQRFLYAPEESFDEFPQFMATLRENLIDEKFHHIHLISENPDLLQAVDKDRLSRWGAAQGQALKGYMQRVMKNEIKWTIAAVPNQQWAESVFSNRKGEEAVDALWKSIFQATRVDLENPVEAWNDHNEQLKKHEDFLNAANFEKMLYKGPGTDLEVYLAKNHVWIGGMAPTVYGEDFMANIPTEEVFSMPHAYKVNGTLRSTKPLLYMGNIIDGMSFTFKDGKVTEYEAKVGKEVLDILMNFDKGSVRLGEIAIVQDDSPISNTGLLFKNTLFDENASCHFAFGKAYPENNKNKDLDEQKMKEIGMNDSMTHVDFMVGGPELSIIGVKHDGTQVAILEKGNWAID